MDQRFYVSSPYIDAHIGSPVSIVSADLHGARFIANMSYFFQRNLVAAWCINIKISHIVYMCSEHRVKTYYHNKPSFALKKHPDFNTSKRYFNHPNDITDI